MSRTLLRVALGLLCAAAALAVRAEDPFVDAEFGDREDAMGGHWYFDGRGTARDNSGYLRDAMRLQIGNATFQDQTPKQTAGGNEYVLTQAMGNIKVTRRIWLDEKRGAARWLDVFENTGAKPSTIQPILLLQFHGQQLTGSDGKPFAGKLDKDQCGIATANTMVNQGIPGFYVVICDPRGNLRPTLNRQAQRVLSITWSLSLAPNSSLALVTWVGQNPGSVSPSSFDAFHKRGKLLDPQVPAALRSAVVNFHLTGGGEETSGTGLGAALEAADALGLERGDADVLSLQQDAHLVGTASGGMIELVTARGTASVPLADAALLLGHGSGLAPRVFLRNGEILVGTPAASDLRFVAAGSGLEIPVASAHARALLLRIAPSDGKPPEGAVAFLETLAGERFALRADPAAALDVATPWGPLRVPLDRVARLQRVSEPQPGHRLVLVDGSRLFVLLPGTEWTVSTLRFGPCTLPVLEVAGIERVGGVPADFDDAAEPPVPYCRLAGDALLTGPIELAAIHVVTAVGETSVDPRRLLSLEPEDSAEAEGCVRIGLASGGVLAGRLRESELPVRLAEGVLIVPARHLRLVRAPKSAAAAASSGAPDNESAAVGALRAIFQAEGFWRQNDPDDNLLEDFWTADVYGLAMCIDDQGKPIGAIPPALALADRHPSVVPGTAYPRPYYTDPLPAAPVPYRGYVFEALEKDREGKPYAGDRDGGGKSCEHPARFGFRAVPAEYGVTGKRIFQVDEQGTVWARDPGVAPGKECGSWEGGADPATASPAWKEVP